MQTTKSAIRSKRAKKTSPQKRKWSLIKETKGAARESGELRKLFHREETQKSRSE